MMNIIPINGQTWLVCGGRNFADGEMFNSVMSQLLALKGCPSTIVHGAARGADALADHWAKQMAINVIGVVADWDIHGRTAGPLRNQRMIDDHKPVLVIAFPGGKGTADMVRRARASSIDVAEIVPAAPQPADAKGAGEIDRQRQRM